MTHPLDQKGLEAAQDAFRDARCNDCTTPEAVAEALTAYLQEAGDGWQPIETAREDGTRVWLYHPWFPAPANHMSVGSRYVGDQYWYSEKLGSLKGPKAPTHWLPLPPPPGEKE